MAYLRQHINDILKKNKPFTYGDLLNTYQWLEVRERILKLDAGTCQKCGDYGTKERDGQHFEDWSLAVDKPAQLGWTPMEERVTLEVHHQYYIKGRWPWQYEDTCYLTLCSKCHREKHEKFDFEVWDPSKKKILTLTPCDKCHGVGWFDCWQHIENGVCFRCDGFKYKELTLFYRYGKWKNLVDYDFTIEE